MNTQSFPDRKSQQGLPVYRADAFVVHNGANLGDTLSDARDLMLDDVYQLCPAARRWNLSISATDGHAHLTVLDGSQVGTVQAQVHLDCCATFMAPDGTIVEAVILVELERGTDLIAATYMLPMADLHPRIEYSLVSVDTDAARAKFAELACVSFTRGTRITMGSGEQRRIEDICVGDRVLTRDNGIQQVRWIGSQTVRATGAFAPIVIAAGALNNANELRLSPNQRLFIYQREDMMNAGQAEVVVKAELLVNGDSVVRGDGGFVEYYQILFDNHEFIYAEGIATESLTVDTRTSPALPRDIQDKLGLARGRRGDRSRPHPVDLGEGMLDSAIAADILRRASSL